MSNTDCFVWPLAEQVQIHLYLLQCVPELYRINFFCMSKLDHISYENQDGVGLCVCKGSYPFIFLNIVAQLSCVFKTIESY